MIDCVLIPKRREPGTELCSLAACQKERGPRRPIWCSDRCSKLYYQTIAKNHHYSTARRAARKRDKYTCQTCGANKKSDPNIKLEVNHIVPLVGTKRSYSCLNHLDNLTTLCRADHLIVTNAQRAERKLNASN